MSSTTPSRNVIEQGGVFLGFALLYAVGTTMISKVEEDAESSAMQLPDRAQLLVAVVVGMVGVLLYNLSGKLDEQIGSGDEPSGSGDDQQGAAEKEPVKGPPPAEREAMDLIRQEHGANPRDFTVDELAAFTGGTWLSRRSVRQLTPVARLHESARPLVVRSVGWSVFQRVRALLVGLLRCLPAFPCPCS